MSPHWFLDGRLEGPRHHGNSEVGFEMKSGIQLICRLGEFPGCGHTVCVRVCREWKFCQFEVSCWTNDKYHHWANSPMARLMSGAFRITQARCELLGKMTVFINITFKIVLWKELGLAFSVENSWKQENLVWNFGFDSTFVCFFLSFLSCCLVLLSHVFALRRRGKAEERVELS